MAKMIPKPIDMISAVKELHRLSSQELSKLLRDADDDTIQWTTSNGSSKQMELETLARYLSWHLLATLFESKRDEELFRYMLSGIRLLHALCDLAPRNSKLEQVLLDDVTVSEQMLDLTFYVIIVLRNSCQESLLHSALLSCCLYLLLVFASSQFNELALILLAHPKVDMVVFGAFSALHIDIQFLQTRLSGTVVQLNLAEVNRLCQHCEASLQFLQSLCQQRLFRERLVKNKDVCEDGGILKLAHDIMKLPFCEDSYLMAVVSRLKSKILSILLNLCEVESVSFLDVVASTTEGLNLAKSTIFQVFELLRTMFRGDLNGLAAFSDKTYPRGLLQLNAMRLTDILSDDSNFRSYTTLNFTEVLTIIFLQPPAEFFSSWCSSESRPSEEDATLDYDSFTASGWVLGVLPSSVVPESTFNACRAPRTSYAFQRTSLLVKVVANLTCFIPDICKEEKDLFLNTFMQCLQKELPNQPYGVSDDVRAIKADIINQNLRSLLIHAESLIPAFLNQDDVQLFKLFIAQLEPLITQETIIDSVLEANVRGQESLEVSNRVGNENKSIPDKSPLEELKQLVLCGNEDPYIGLQMQDQKKDAAQTFPARVVQENDGDAQNVETSGLDSNTMQVKNSVKTPNPTSLHSIALPKGSQDLNQDKSVLGKESPLPKVMDSDVRFGALTPKVKGDNFSNQPPKPNFNGNGVSTSSKEVQNESEEKQLRKRKRNIMNHMQITMIEQALQNEPDMQRKAATIQSWAEKISLHGTEISSSQLKNWLNNRRAKLARAAAKDIPAPSTGDNTFTDKQGGSGTDPESESPEELFEPNPTTTQVSQQQRSSEPVVSVTVKHEPGQFVVLADGQGEEIGKGYVHQVSGLWSGTNLDESVLCVVDVTYLKVDKWSNLPHPSDGTGTSFGHAEQIFGVRRVLWESAKLLLQKPI